MWETFVSKFMKSELWVAMLGVFAATLAPKLGVPEEVLTEFFISVTTIVVTYVGGRTMDKASTSKAKAKAIEAATSGTGLIEDPS